MTTVSKTVTTTDMTTTTSTMKIRSAKTMDMTTVSEAGEDAGTPDPYAVAEEAADAFLTALHAAIDRLPQRPDITEPAEALRRALDRLRPGSVEPVLAAASAT